MKGISPGAIQVAQALMMMARGGMRDPHSLRGKKFATRSVGTPQDDDGEWERFKPADMEGMVAWGQTKRLTFHPVQYDTTGYEQTAVSIVKNDLVQTEALEEPILRTFSCYVNPNCQQEGNDPAAPPTISEIADVPIAGRLVAAVGGSSQTIYFSWKNGTVITVPAMTWDVSAWIEPIGRGVFIPDGKSVLVGVTVSTQAHPGGTMVPSRDYVFMYAAAIGPPAFVPWRVPPFAQQFKFTSADPLPVWDVQVMGLGGTPMYVIPAANFVQGQAYDLPMGAASVEVKYSGAVPTPIGTMSMLLGL